MQSYSPSPYPQQPAPAGAFIQAAPPAGYGSYEFNETENTVLATLSTRVKVWGVIAIVIGALYTLSGLFFFVRPALLGNLFTGVIDIVVGVMFFGAGNALTRVVQTQGNDLANLMSGMQKLTRAFTIQIVTVIIGFLLVLAAIAIGVLIAVSHHA